MWPLKKPDPDVGFTTEDAFLFALVMLAGYFLWMVLFPWFPFHGR